MNIYRGNMFRSQVAEAFFKRKHQNVGHRVSNTLVQSCGTWVEKEGLTGKKLKDFDGHNLPWDLNNVIEVMKEKGIDISKNVCKPITPELVNWADKIISMAEENESPDYLLNNPKVIFWEVENPSNFTKELAREVVEKNRKISIYSTLFIAITRRDFLRAAVFFFITPLLAVLSIALYAFGKSAIASSFFFSPISFLISFIIPLISPSRRRLKTRLRAEFRIAFFADIVIAIFRLN